MFEVLNDRSNDPLVKEYDNLPGLVAKFRIAEDGLHFLYGNERFMRFHEVESAEEPSGLLLSNLQNNKEVLEANHEAFRAGAPVNFEVRSMNGAEAETYFQIFGGCVEHMQGDPVYLFVFIDITELVSQRTRLQELAFVDPVTGGFNRARFELEAGQAVNTALPDTYTLVTLDLQKFKVVNDLFGIKAGDKTLKHIHNRILGHLEEGEYAARIASDDFSILFKTKERQKIEARIAAIVDDINAFNQKITHKYYLMFAAGAYLIDDPAISMTQIQDRVNVARKQVADIADGKLFACRFYSNKDRIVLAREKEIENRMRDALENKEFEIYLQPKQSVKNGEVAGAEALVRWNDPEAGLLTPEEFIFLFEKNGFIVDMDLYVFEQTCMLLRKWIDFGIPPVPISVNMSRAHLAAPRFLDRYEEIRKRYQVPGELLEIEFTETLVFENPQLLSQVIDDIHSCNYRCSMDDFGSGYSSLNVLKNIRVDVLKLDKAFFLSDQIKNPWEEAVVGVIVELAQKLGMKTVAEGVETKEQAAFLKNAGCDMIQGYLVSRPVPVEQFEAFTFGKALA